MARASRNARSTRLEAAFAEANPSLRRRLRGMLGSAEAADDVLQETFLRAWQHAPDADDERTIQAWLKRTATNLALDELRRRRRRPESSLDAALALAPDVHDRPDARAALAELTAHERFILLMRFEAGLSSAELAALLGVSEAAARKRVERARARFRERARAIDAAEGAPLITVVSRDGTLDRYQRWLADAGARVRAVSRVTLRELVYADGVLIGSAGNDVHPATYGEAIAAPLHGVPDQRADRSDLAAMQAALAENVPLIGICTGHQLLNVLSGGTLYQDLEIQEPRAVGHAYEEHAIETRDDSSLRRILGRGARVQSVHHQAVRRLGARLRVVAASPDGVVEAVERTDRFAVGVQWLPESAPDETPSRLLAEAFVAHASRRAGHGARTANRHGPERWRVAQ